MYCGVVAGFLLAFFGNVRFGQRFCRCFYRRLLCGPVPPRATASQARASRTASATTGTVGHPLSAGLTACSWASARSTSIPAARTTVPSVVSCVASRNKRCLQALRNGRVYPNKAAFTLHHCGRTPGSDRNSRRASGVLRASRGEASGPRGSANRKSTAYSPPNSPPVRPRRAPLAPLKRRSRRGRRFCESRYSLSAPCQPMRLRCRSATIRIFPRAGRNLIQTRTTRLDDFLLQLSRAGRASTALGPGGPRVPAVSGWLCQPKSSNRSLFARLRLSSSYSCARLNARS